MADNKLKNIKKYPIFKAILNDRPKTLKELVKMGASLNDTDIYGRTPLMYAIIHKKQDMVETLINAGADMNIKDKKSNWTALDYAIYTRQEDIAEMMIQAGFDVHTRSGIYQWTPLMRASASGLEKTVRCLLDHKANINATDDTMNETALMCAVYTKRTDIVKLLIEAGAKMDIRNRAGRCVVDIAYDLSRNTYEEDVKIIYRLCVDAALKAIHRPKESFFNKLFKHKSRQNEG